MEGVPTEILCIICFNLTIPWLKNFTLCNRRNNSIITKRFVKAYVKNYNIFYRSVSNLRGQLGFIHNYKNKANLITVPIKYFNDVVITNCLQLEDKKIYWKLIPLLNYAGLKQNDAGLKMGDLVILEIMPNEKFIFNGTKLKSMEISRNNEIQLPKEFSIIDTFCPSYWDDHLWYSFYKFFIDMTPYIDQIKANMKEDKEIWKNSMTTEFYTKYGKKYVIVVEYITDEEKAFAKIMTGWFKCQSKNCKWILKT